MKKASITGILSLVFLMNSAFAQTVTSPAPSAGKYYVPKNISQIKSMKQQLSHNNYAGQRRGAQTIMIDYAASNGDTLFFATDMNMHYTLPPDTFGSRYVVVGYDSLHDAVSDVGFKYSDFDSVRIDSLLLWLGHKHASPKFRVPIDLRLCPLTGCRPSGSS